MVFEQLAQTVLNFVNWGITIVVIMLIWEIIQFIRGGTEERGENSSGIGKKSLGEIKDSFNEWTGRAEVEKKKKVSRAASREETAMLNEYVEEKKELEKIDSAVEEGKNFLATLNTPKIKASEVKSGFTKLDKAIQAAGKETSALKRNTWRERRKMKDLYQALDGAGVSKGEIQKVQALENSILERHNYVIAALAKAAGSMGRLNATANSAKDPLPPKTLTSIREAMIKEITPSLQNAQGSQRSAYKDTEGLIAKIRAVWK